MDDTKLMEAYAELRLLADAEHTLPRVKDALLRLRDHTTKLFVATGDPSADALPRLTGDARTVDCVASRLEPSNFLCKLLAAGRALEWPKVMVLVHSLSPSGIEITIGMREVGADILRAYCEYDCPELGSERIFRAMWDARLRELAGEEVRGRV